MAEIGVDIEKASQLLMQNELVAIPTETVYGLAGNALDKTSVTKIFAVKDRPHFDPLIVHVADLERAKEFVTEIPEQAQQLADDFWPGPVTLLLKKKKIIPDLVTAGLDTVGIRCPNHELTQKLLRKLTFPLAAPSANPFGYVSPTKPEHVQEQLGNKINYILDGGPCAVGIESTIIGFENETPVVYRLGGLSIEQIEKAIGKVTLMTHSTSNPKAPGQLKSHYAPMKKVFLGPIEELLLSFPAHSAGILTFQKDFNSPFQFILSPSGNLDEAAQNIFEGLRSFDKMPVDVILAEPVPNVGLGRAINDRLQRAAVL
jgi:L-threonylcarbamoyladenylate synthase